MKTKTTSNMGETAGTAEVDPPTDGNDTEDGTGISPGQRTKQEGSSKSPLEVCSSVTTKASREKGSYGKSSQKEVKSRTESKTRNNSVKKLRERKRLFECSTCGKGFQTQGYLVSHMRCHSGEKPFTCTLCGKTYRDKNNLKIHLRTHTGELPYLCKHCGKGFTAAGALKKHERTHTGEKPHGCETCGKRFISPAELRCHVRTHTKEKPFFCSKCTSCFSQMSALKKHEMTHSGEKPHKCVECNQAFLGHTKLQEHLIKHHNQDGRYNCTLCGKTFMYAYQLKKHESNHAETKPYGCTACGRCYESDAALKAHQLVHGLLPDADSEGKRYTCTLCDKTYSTAHGYCKHMTRTHADEADRYVCSVCGKEFKEATGLKKHEMTHTGERPLKCDICGKGFIFSLSLKRHKMKHTGELPFKCPTCGQGFFYKTRLTTHLLSHSGVKPYSCTTCGKGFTTSRQYEEHQLVHGATKPFLCSTCGMSFKVRRYLREHVKIHATNNPHRCKYCDKVFTKSTDRLIHERSHTGDKPFKCSTCAKSFACVQRLTRHAKTHTGAKPFSCSECGKKYTELGSLRVHIRRAHPKDEKKVYNCSDCNVVFQDKTEFESHMDIHENERSPAAENYDAISGENVDQPQPVSSIVQTLDSQAGSSSSSSFDNAASFLKETTGQNSIQTAGYLDVLINALTEREPLELNMNRTTQFSNQESHRETAQVIKISSISETLPTEQSIANIDLISRHFRNGIETSNQNSISPDDLRRIEQEPDPNVEIQSSDTQSQLNQVSQQHLDELQCSVRPVSTPDNQHSETSDLDQNTMNPASNNSQQIVNIQENTDDSHPKTFHQLDSTGVDIGGPMLTPTPADVQLQPAQVYLETDPNKGLTQTTPQPDTYQNDRHNLCYLDSTCEGGLNQAGYIQTYMGSLSNQSYTGLSQLSAFPDINIPVTSSTVADINPTLQTVNAGLMYINLNSDRVYSQVTQFVSDMSNPTSSASYQTLPATSSPVFTNIATNSGSASGSASFIGQFSDRSDTVFNLQDSSTGGFDINMSADINKPETYSVDNSSKFDSTGFVTTSSESKVAQSEVSNANPQVSHESQGQYTCPAETDTIPAQFETALEQEATSPDISHDQSEEINPSKNEQYDQIPCVDLINELPTSSNHNEHLNDSIDNTLDNDENSSNKLHDNVEESMQRHPNLCNITGEAITDNRQPAPDVSESETSDLLPVSSFQMETTVESPPGVRGGYPEEGEDDHVLPGHEPCSCSICGQEFDDADQLKRHVRTHTGTKPYQCSHCGTGFVTVYAMEKHLMIHRDERPFQCQVCEKRFRRRAEMDKHFRIHTDERPFACTVCSKTFRQQSGLNNHLRVHTGESPYVCEFCGKGFKQSTQMKRHLVVHTGEKKFKCKLCEEAFCYSDALKRHEKIHQSEKPMLRCDRCDKLCSSRLHLKRHMASHGPDEKKPCLKCPFCYTEFKQQRTLDAHLKKFHDRAENECPICKRQFKSESSLKRHQTTKHKTRAKSKKAENVTEMQNTEYKSNLRTRTSTTRNSHTGLSKVEPNDSGSDQKNNAVFQDGGVLFKENTSTKGNQTALTNDSQTPEKCQGDNIPASPALICTVCGEQFTEARALNRHVRQHTGTHPFRCTTCGRCFTEASTLKKHIGVHRKDKHLCACCGKVYMSVFSLRAHMKIHAEQVCVCADCGMGFTSGSALKSHTQEAHYTGSKSQVTHSPESKSQIAHSTDSKSQITHCAESESQGAHPSESKSTTSLSAEQPKESDSKRPSLSCSVCKESFSDEQLLVTHMKRHQTDVCTACGEGFTSRRTLEEHLYTAHTLHTASSSFRCSLCDQDFTHSADLRLHLQTHVGVRKGPDGSGEQLRYRCSVCEQVFPAEEQLKAHLKGHLRERNHLCATCGKGFLSAGQLKIHTRTHTGEKPYKCGTCGQAFHYPGYLTVHRRTHTGERPYVCTTCGKSFIQVTLLNHHKRLHLEDRPYVCMLCDKRFKSNRKLTIHKRVHSNDRPYVCGTCGKGFKRLEHCKNHERIHAGQAQHRCEWCEKGFTDPASLRRHHRTHTGERPHACDICGKAFAEAGTLTKHKRTHGDLNRSTARGNHTCDNRGNHMCDICGKGFTSVGMLNKHCRVHQTEDHLCGVCGSGFRTSALLRKHAKTHEDTPGQPVSDGAVGTQVEDTAGQLVPTVQPQPLQDGPQTFVMYQVIQGPQ